MSILKNEVEAARIKKYALAAYDIPGACKNNYRGLRIHALDGLHEFIGTLITDALAPGNSIVELGAGQGALSLRLADQGFQVTATDIVEENFKAKNFGIPFISVNLNKEDWIIPGMPFDAVVATEIIEHLENPRAFLRSCKEILKPNGKVIISTPNIENPISKAIFCRKGSWRWFSEDDYVAEGHITPVSKWMLCKMAEEAGFKATLLSSFGDQYRSFGKTWRIALLACLIACIDQSPKSLRGEILVGVFQKNNT